METRSVSEGRATIFEKPILLETQRFPSLTLRVFISLLLIAPLVGCGGEKWPLTPLKGAVTVDGTPVETGTISFAPVESNMGPDVPLPIVAGRYEGAVPKGKVKVFLQATRETGKMVTMFGKEEPEVVNVIPDRYAAGIELDTAAATEHDFKLIADPPR